MEGIKKEIILDERIRSKAIGSSGSPRRLGMGGRNFHKQAWKEEKAG